MSATANAFHISLLVATLLVTLVCGVALIFAIVIMPGIGNLENGEFLRAFQAIDGIIQNIEPVFVFIWIGSIAMILLTAGLGLAELDGPNKAMIVTATMLYLSGQITTFTINVPLNNRVKILDIKHLDEMSKVHERNAFEPKWNRWNTFRTFTFGATSIYLLVLLLVENY